jgi:DNA-directed RNA polymerase specialized sigma24 family protein
MDEPSVELVARWRRGDQEAAAALFGRYVDRLVALTRARMSEKLARRLDPEDVVQSAYRSFFVAARDGRSVPGPGGHMWPLLVAITLRKLYDQFDRHTADKRALNREQNLPADNSTFGLSPELLARDPSPVEAMALAEELADIMSGLEPLHRRILELWLQGKDREEIAAATQRSLRTVRRVLETVQYLLEQRCRATFAADAAQEPPP